MRKPLLWIASVILLLAAAVLAPARAAEPPAAPPAAAKAPAAAPALCLAAGTAHAQPAAPLAGLAPDPLFANTGTCTVFCHYGGCTRDSDCTAFPNGNCSNVCPKVGCCFYP
jgi:hypothetical protein